MKKFRIPVPLEDGQTMHLVPIGDIHFDTDECDRPRLKRFVQWVEQHTAKGELVRLVGLGDYLDWKSPSERTRTRMDHETTVQRNERDHLDWLKKFMRVVSPIKENFLGLVTGHHHHPFESVKTAGSEWIGRSSDEWICAQLGCAYWGSGVVFARLDFPHRLYLDMLLLHGNGGGQTYGARVQKRVRFAEIAPTAHLVISGHDNAKFAYPRSGLDFEHGAIKRYVIASGSFQRAYLEEGEPGYAEQMGLIPADLGVSIVTITTEKRKGKWRVDYHVSV